MTDRLIYPIAIFTHETCYKATARIMQSMNAKISGDTVIHILLKKY